MQRAEQGDLEIGDNSVNKVCLWEKSLAPDCTTLAYRQGKNCINQLRFKKKKRLKCFASLNFFF